MLFDGITVWGLIKLLEQIKSMVLLKYDAPTPFCNTCIPRSWMLVGDSVQGGCTAGIFSKEQHTFEREEDTLVEEEAGGIGRTSGTGLTFMHFQQLILL